MNPVPADDRLVITLFASRHSICPERVINPPVAALYEMPDPVARPRCEMSIDSASRVQVTEMMPEAPLCPVGVPPSRPRVIASSASCYWTPRVADTV